MRELDDGLGSIDHNLRPCYWHNMDNRQHHVFVSILNTGWPGLGKPGGYPHLTEYRPRIIAKPGMVTLIPHRYYRIFTRDDKPPKGAWVVGQMIEDASPTQLSHGEAMGVENKVRRT